MSSRRVRCFILSARIDPQPARNDINLKRQRLTVFSVHIRADIDRRFYPQTRCLEINYIFVFIVFSLHHIDDERKNLDEIHILEDDHIQKPVVDGGLDSELAESSG